MRAKGNFLKLLLDTINPSYQTDLFGSTKFKFTFSSSTNFRRQAFERIDFGKTKTYLSYIYSTIKTQLASSLAKGNFRETLRIVVWSLWYVFRLLLIFHLLMLPACGNINSGWKLFRLTYVSLNRFRNVIIIARFIAVKCHLSASLFTVFI